MANSGKLTATAKIGPGNSVTSMVLSNLTDLHIDFANRVLTAQAAATPPTVLDFNAATTITASISGAVVSITVS